MDIPKRVMLDSIEVRDYTEQGIHYWFDEKSVIDGQILIWGPSNTIYEDMPMVYSVKFTTGYPFDPPKVSFMTTDSHTRFHPNMYIDGKVCLSILGTWDGPRWVASQRFSSIPLTLQSLMTNNPIEHEPGYEKRNDDKAISYNEYVTYRCLVFLVNIIERYSNNKLPFILDNFKDEFLERLPNILKSLETRLENAQIDKQWLSIPYGMTGKTNYAELKVKLAAAKQKLVVKS